MPKTDPQTSATQDHNDSDYDGYSDCTMIREANFAELASDFVMKSLNEGKTLPMLRGEMMWELYREPTRTAQNLYNRQLYAAIIDLVTVMIIAASDAYCVSDGK
ncbi:hypothetical protein MFIFM68171_01773 [Madurella fahalii]|uniref:Uncharacterized protein n=1 Tax=Madurella fahalii TaxID=1157608 RepID=A0ABQ0G1D0_9PEZI